MDSTLHAQCLFFIENQFASEITKILLTRELSDIIMPSNQFLPFQRKGRKWKNHCWRQNLASSGWQPNIDFCFSVCTDSSFQLRLCTMLQKYPYWILRMLNLRMQPRSPTYCILYWLWLTCNFSFVDRVFGQICLREIPFRHLTASCDFHRMRSKLRETDWQIDLVTSFEPSDTSRHFSDLLL